MDGIIMNVPPEIVACMREARYPTIHELTRLAERIRGEVYGTKSAFAWGGSPDEDSARSASLRLAQAALIGSMVVTVAPSAVATVEQVSALPI